MNSRIINAPRRDVVRMLERRMPKEAREELQKRSFTAVGLVQTSIPNLYYYADIAQKASNVFVTELTGNCPQNITSLALFGETSAVKAALSAVENSR
jgi:hypothetical protein